MTDHSTFNKNIEFSKFHPSLGVVHIWRHHWGGGGFPNDDDWWRRGEGGLANDDVTKNCQIFGRFLGISSDLKKNSRNFLKFSQNYQWQKENFQIGNWITGKIFGKFGISVFYTDLSNISPNLEGQSWRKNFHEVNNLKSGTVYIYW